MRKISFLSKLKQQDKIQFVKPSEEIKQAYLKKSDKSLNSAKVLFEVGNFEDSVALAYYSMYYSVLALLFRIGVKCENHAGAVILLKSVFNIDNSRIFTAKKERVDKQYYVDFSVTKKEVAVMIKTAEEFNNELLNFIEALTSEKVKKYRDIAVELIDS